MPRFEQFGVGDPVDSPDTDPFAVLGVSPEADVVDIRDAYRVRAKELHPDVNGGLTEEAMKHLNAARELAANIVSGEVEAPEQATSRLAQAFVDALGHIARSRSVCYEQVRPVRLEDFGPGIMVQEVKRAAYKRAA